MVGPPSDTTAGRTVLVVEDHDDLRELYSYWLRHDGFEVLSAAGGSEAIQIIEGCTPDVLVVDVHLRTVAGDSVLHEITEDARTCQIPVVAIRACTTDKVSANVAAVLCKPIAEADLTSAVRAAAERALPHH